MRGIWSVYGKFHVMPVLSFTYSLAPAACCAVWHLTVVLNTGWCRQRLVDRHLWVQMLSLVAVTIQLLTWYLCPRPCGGGGFKHRCDQSDPPVCTMHAARKWWILGIFWLLYNTTVIGNPVLEVKPTDRCGACCRRRHVKTFTVSVTIEATNL